jgi:hypothetical protein
MKQIVPERSAARLARLTGGQEVGSSNLPVPTEEGLVTPVLFLHIKGGEFTTTLSLSKWSRGERSEAEVQPNPPVPNRKDQ